MEMMMQNRNRDLSMIGKHWGWFSLWGIALIVLGTLAICASELTTLVSVFLLGAVIFAAGVVVALDTLSFWWGKWSGFFLHFLMAVIYIVGGVWLMKSPLAGAVSFTLILGIIYTMLGAFRIGYSLTMHMLGWGWSLFNGVITLLLGILILANWPASSLIIIGLFVGIDLIFCGWAYLMVAMAAKSITVSQA